MRPGSAMVSPETMACHVCDEAIVELERAVQADPLQLSASSLLSLALSFARRFPEAIAQGHKALALDSMNAVTQLGLGRTEAFGPRPENAVVTLERARKLHPKDSRVIGTLLYAYAATGRWADAKRLHDDLHRPGLDEFDGIQAAFGDLVFGDREPLVNLLTSDAGLHRYVRAAGFLGCDPRFDPLWSDARFRAKMIAPGTTPCAVARPWSLPPRR
jgi:hypothetical protein